MMDGGCFSFAFCVSTLTLMLRFKGYRAAAALTAFSCGSLARIDCHEGPKEKHDWMRAPSASELKELTKRTLPSARADAQAKGVPLPAALRAAEKALGNTVTDELPTFTAGEVSALADDHYIVVTHGDGVYNVTDFVK